MLPLEVKNIRYSVNQQLLLNNLSLCIKHKGTTAVLGFNGAGKSLLLRAMHGLIQPQYGSIQYAGQLLDRTVRLRQAMVFQKPVLLRRSVIANMNFVLHSRGQHDSRRACELLDLVDLADKKQQLARALSGGEQQRLALAMALCHKPEVLFLDEVSASLDPASTARIELALQQVAGNGCTLVMVTHDLAQVRRLADEIVFVHDGQVVEHNSMERFLDSPQSAVAEAYLAGTPFIQTVTGT